MFSAGVGLDASVVERVDAHPRLKARLGEYYYTWTGIRTFNRHYLIRPPRLEAELGGEQVQGVTAIVQNAAPYTYFGDRRVDFGEGASLDSGDLAGVVLTRASPIDIPTITWRALSKHARLARHRRVHPFSDLTGLRVRSLDERPLPLQVDGDYIGEATEAEFDVAAATGCSSSPEQFVHGSSRQLGAAPMIAGVRRHRVAARLAAAASPLPAAGAAQAHTLAGHPLSGASGRQSLESAGRSAAGGGRTRSG